MKTVKYQSFSHWFFYHKRMLFGIAAFALMAAILYFNHQALPDPDYRVGWVGKTMLNQEEEAALIAEISAHGTDLNGDGQIYVTVVQYNIDFHADATDADAETYYGNTVKLIGQLDTGECYLYFMDDPERFQFATGALRYLDGAPSGEEDHYEYQHWEEMCLPWTCEGLENRTIWLGRRALFDEDADYESAFPGGEALFQALTAS